MTQHGVENKLCWRVTRSCNLHCAHCLAGYGNRTRRDLTSAEQHVCLQQMSLARISRITWTGGEPTLVKTLPELLNGCHSLGIRSLITTHGLGLPERLIDELDQNLDTLRFSFDGLARTHNRIRGGVFFEKTLENARRCVRRGLTVEANITLLEQNVEELSSLITMLSESGIGKVVLMTLMHRESAVDNRVRGLSAIQMGHVHKLVEKMEDQIPNMTVRLNNYDEPSDKYIVVESDGEILLSSEAAGDEGFGYLQFPEGIDALRRALSQQTLTHRHDGLERL